MNGSSDWQRRHLSGNLIHFGMYTSLTLPTRGPDSSTKRQQFEEYLQNLEEEWDSLTPELRETGNWPVVGSSEMLCRWDMQGAPPDILVTNYSMLEYMLIRPIEKPRVRHYAGLVGGRGRPDDNVWSWTKPTRTPEPRARRSLIWSAA